MFSYIIQDCKEINEKVKTMDKGSLKKRFTIAVVLGVIGALVEVIVCLSGGGIKVGELFILVLLSLIGGIVCIFAYFIEWKLLFRPFVAAFHSRTFLFIKLILIGIACAVYSFIGFYIGMRGIFAMNSWR